jgi:prepilin-type N-terminal cleavage/methylation domain-containing protein
MKAKTLLKQNLKPGFSLMELLIAVSLSSVLLIAILSVTVFTARSYAAMVNYVDLDSFSRSALDSMTSEIREADCLLDGTATSMRFQFSNATNAQTWTVDYVYNPDARTLTRIQEGLAPKLMLSECNFLELNYFKRNPSTNNFDLFSTATPPVINPQECKAIQLSWVCSRDIMQRPVNTESVQSARVVIRKK